MDPASQKRIREWLERFDKKQFSHMIVVCDTWDHDDYPVGVKKTEDITQKVKYYGTNMQRVMEVYDLSMDIEKQLLQTRAWNF